MTEHLLEAQNLGMQFGGLVALDSVNLSIRDGEILALIGPNGAGKTTFFNCITGIYVPTSGKVIVRTKSGKPKKINGLKPNQVTILGLARTFQNIRLFSQLTVLENVMVGRHCRLKAGILGAFLLDRRTRKEEQETIALSYHLLSRFGLDHFANTLACNLPYGAQRRLEIVRALATDPTVLLLDEPAAGLNIGETRELVDLINRIRNEDRIAILLIEHDMSLVMTLSDRIYVLDYGRMISEGTPEQIKNDPKVIRAYLGEDIE